MKIVYFYAPHFIWGVMKQVPDHMSDFNEEILKRTMADDSLDVFCIPSGLSHPLPVGTVVRFGTVHIGG